MKIRLMLFMFVVIAVICQATKTFTDDKQPQSPTKVEQDGEDLAKEFLWLSTLKPQRIRIAHISEINIDYYIYCYPQGMRVSREYPKLPVNKEQYLVEDVATYKLRYTIYFGFRRDPKSPLFPQNDRKSVSALWVWVYVQGAPAPNQYYTSQFEFETDVLKRALDENPEKLNAEEIAPQNTRR